MTDSEKLSKGSLSFTATTAPEGYIKLWDGFFVACRKRPSDDHMKAMESAFGWEWREFPHD